MGHDTVQETRPDPIYYDPIYYPNVSITPCENRRHGYFHYLYRYVQNLLCVDLIFVI